MRMLIVDDETDIQLLLKRYFRKAGFETRSAGTLQDARGLVGPDWRPDIVLLDINLPDGLGTEFIPYLEAEAPAARIVIVSAYLQQVRQDEWSVHAFLPKPFLVEELGRIVEEAMN